MHTCGMCGQNSKPKETAIRVILETRPKTYDQPVNGARRRNPLSFREIVKEVVACAKCGTNPSIVKRVGNTVIALADLNLFQGARHAYSESR